MVPLRLRRRHLHHVMKWPCLMMASFCLANSVLAQESTSVIVDHAKQHAVIEEIPLTGTVVSQRVARLSAEVSGIVETMSVEVGDQVQAGDEILRLNQELDALTLSAARAATEQAALELEDARRRLADTRTLATRQTVSANELESLAAEVRIDSAELDRFKAEQQRHEARLRRHKLAAPFSGVISRRMTEQGEWIQPGQAVVELVALQDLRVDFQAPQSVLGKLDRETGIQVRLDALPGATLEGSIDTVIPVTDPGTRTFLIRAALDDPRIRLSPGMSASAVLRLNTDTPGVVVPRDAIMRYPDGRVTVWVVNQNHDNNTVSERQVETGLNFKGMVTITRGLEADTPVVVQGNEALRDGQSVNINWVE